LMDAQAGALRKDQELGVEEPGLVSYARNQLLRDGRAHGFEAALCVAEVGSEGETKHEHVAARDDLALRTARDTRAAREAAPDREVAVPGEQRCDQRVQRVEIRRKIDVHVRDDRGITL